MGFKARAKTVRQRVLEVLSRTGAASRAAIQAQLPDVDRIELGVALVVLANNKAVEREYRTEGTLYRRRGT